VVTLNEEERIRQCLESVVWADETIVVDAESQDKTAAIARELTDHVIVRPWPGFAAQKNFGLAQASGDWILSLDADELVSPALRAEITAVLEGHGEAAGYAVRLEAAGCCGRASISKGLLDQARDMAADMTARLAPYAERGVPITGCEPSCLLTLREEHLALQPGDERAGTVAGQARLVEELLVEAIDAGALHLRPGPRRIVFHGHCHQKALAGTAATVELLRRIPGADVVELDAGCCGMAGSFGFEQEHYDLSMQIGETRLFPALRGEEPATLLAATGVSCRQQIAHGVGREARHPVQIVRDAL